MTAGKKQTKPAKRKVKAFPIIGIGASAGGLDAIGSFFGAMPDEFPDMAFVVVSHLDPGHSSILPGLLQRHTRMVVQAVIDGMEAQPHRVYVIPPDRDLKLQSGKLRLTPGHPSSSPRAPINHFFRSLAEQQAEMAVGIILSGMGSDGTIGIQCIKGELGMVMVQEPTSAKYDGMPQSAIQTGLADFVLPPGEMPGQLITYVDRMLKGDPIPAEKMSSEMSTLIHELRIHQVELEMQNEELRKSEQEKITILDSLMEHVIYHDGEMKILWANKAACESAHLKREDLLRRNCYELWADRRAPCEDCPVIAARETGKPQMAEKMTPDGRWWHIQGHPIRDSNGHVTGMTELTLDITERRHAEEIVRKARKDLEIKVTERTAELFAANEKLRQEIEERKQAEEALRANETKYRTLVDNITIGVALINSKMEVLTINAQLQKWFPNISRDKTPLCYQAFNDPPGEGVCPFCPTIQTFQDGQVHESLMQTPAGDEIRNYRVISSPIKDAAGKIVAGIEMIEDVTERMRTRKDLQESERRYKSIFENAPIGFYRTTPDGRVLDANPALIQMLGYSSFEELAAVNLETHAYQPQYTRHQFRERIEQEGQIRGLESFWKKPDDTLIPIRENAVVVRDEKGAPVCYEGTVEDLTDQKKAEEHIQVLTHQLMQAQEDERQMLSRELHDTVAQELSVAKMAGDLIYNELLNGRQPEAQRIQAICDALQKTISDVRSMSYDLRPPELDELGLVETIYRFCEEFVQIWGVPVDFQAAGFKSLKLGHEDQINLYRLVQEGLTNIRKHAAAGRVTVKLTAAFPNIKLRIEDNGRGFDVQKRAAAAGHEKRIGLRSMQERVNLMNGEMKLQSKPGRGTKVTIKLPIGGKKRGA